MPITCWGRLSSPKRNWVALTASLQSKGLAPVWLTMVCNQGSPKSQLRP